MMFQKRRIMAEINIVPYVDVMLVLLVIFMVTAPLLTQGVQVDLPSASSQALPENDKPPLVVTVDAKGEMYLDQSKTPLLPTDLGIQIQVALRQDPTRAVLVKGDAKVDYGHVVTAMVLLKRAGATKVGLMTAQDEE